MTTTKGYGQYCPIAIAAEIVAERWTPLVLRSLFLGAIRFNEIQQSVPRMSTALLSRRLKELEFANIVISTASSTGRGREYRLTKAGRELFPVLDTMGGWAQKWLRRDIVQDDNLDPDVLMWEMRRAVLNAGVNKDTGRHVIQFQLDGVPRVKRFYWLVCDPQDVDICVRDPGHEVGLWIASHIRTLIEIWLGHRNLSTATQDGSLRIEGASADVKAFHQWFVLSHFAPAAKRATETSP